MLHPNRSCWLLPPPPPGVGAGGQGPWQAGGQQQTLGNRGLVGGPLGPPWLQLLSSPQLPPFSPPGPGQRPRHSQNRREPLLQGRWGEGRKEAAESVCHESSNCCSITTSDELLLYTRCSASLVPEPPQPRHGGSPCPAAWGWGGTSRYSLVL